MNFAGRSSFSRQSFVQQETKWAAGPSNWEESSFRHRQPLRQFVNNFEISGNLLYFSAIASTMLCKSVEKEKRPAPRTKERHFICPEESAAVSESSPTPCKSF